VAGYLVKGLRAAVGFMTTIPVSIKEGDYESFLGHIYLFIPVGLLVGLLIGTAGLIFQWLLPAPFAAILTVGSLYLLTGINNIDGLSDAADGMVTSGPPEKKIRSMKDVHAGAGGILGIGLDLLFLYALISTFAGFDMPILYPLFVAEACSKVSMITVIAFGKSLGPGMGAIAIAAAKKSHYFAGITIAIAAIAIAAAATGTFYTGMPAWRIWAAAIGAIISPFVVAALLMRAANRNFGGVNGDVMGAASEIGRIAALVVMGVVLWTHW
jgi:adenosylcobinamide-GDP ribazoletransferase